MNSSSLFPQLVQAALPYDRDTKGDEFRLDYKNDLLLSRPETFLALLRGYFRYEVVGLENVRPSSPTM